MSGCFFLKHGVLLDTADTNINMITLYCNLHHQKHKTREHTSFIAVNSHALHRQHSYTCACMSARRPQRKSSKASTLFADSLVLRSVRVWPTDEKSLSDCLQSWPKWPAHDGYTCERTGQLLDCSLQKFSGMHTRSSWDFHSLVGGSSFLPENCRSVSFPRSWATLVVSSAWCGCIYRHATRAVSSFNVCILDTKESHAWLRLFVISVNKYNYNKYTNNMWMKNANFRIAGPNPTQPIWGNPTHVHLWHNLTSTEREISWYYWRQA